MGSKVFLRSLRDQWRSLAVWAAAVVLLTLAVAAFYPSIRQSMASMQDMADKLPKALRDAFIGADIASAPGWLDTKLLSLMVPVLFLVYAIGAGGSSIAGDEEQGTLDLLLAQPVSRTAVALGRFAGMAAGVALLAAALSVSLLASSPAWDMHLATLDVLQAAVLAGLLGLTFGAVAFAVGAGTGRRSLAYGVAGGLALLMYLVNVLAPDSDAVMRLRPVSLFRYYGISPLHTGLSATAAAVFLLTTAVVVAAGVAAFSRRDLG